MSPVVKKIALNFQSHLNRFDPLTGRLGGKAFMFPAWHPIFIIGASRSGSTLLYQLLLRHTRAAYISNLMALIPVRMILAAQLLKEHHVVTEVRPSKFGYVSGLFAPSEAGALFRKWFDNDISDETIKRVRNTFILLSQAFSAPLVSKNLMNSMRLDKIYRILPEARFIHIQRKVLFNAQSLLLARRKLNGSEAEWWSVRPPGYEKVLNRRPTYQVVWQVVETERIINRFLHSACPNCMRIQYESLCDSPVETLDQVVKFFGIQHRKASDDNRVASRNRVRLSPEKWDALEADYAEIMEANDAL